VNDVIVDGNSLFARCWYAAKGEPDQVIRACTLSVLHLLDRSFNNPLGVPISRTMFAWDGKSKTDKKRDPKPAGYVKCRYRFQEVLLTLFNTVHGHHPDYEADDIVATAVFNSKADRVFVVSGDKDLMQLQGGNVSYYDLNSKAVLSPRVICGKFHVKKPSQIPLALAIIGDPGDGISGVPKWGPKKAAKVFEWVTEKMDFEEALFVVQREIPKELHEFFMDALDKTLLFTDVAGVPDPSPLTFCSYDEMRDLGIDGISQSYERVALQYEDKKSTLGGMIKGSISE
jgi:5'-3' exonuclease